MNEMQTTNDSSRVVSWDQLPSEVLSLIFVQLRSVKELVRCAGTCKAWRKTICNSNTSNTIWYNFHRDYYGTSANRPFESLPQTLQGLTGVFDIDAITPLTQAENWHSQFKQDMLILQQLPIEQALVWATSHGYEKIVRKILYANHEKVLVEPAEEDANDTNSHQEENSTERTAEPYFIAKATIDIDTVSPEGLTPLHIATRNGYVEIVEMLLAFGADPDIRVRDSSNKTALHIAIITPFNKYIKPHGPKAVVPIEEQYKKLTMLRLLLAKRADTEAKAKHGLTPLLTAASLNDLQSVELLLENSADVDAEVDDTKMTALHLAVTKRNLNMTQVLLAAGANPDARTNRLNTPLHLAAAANAGDVAEYLIAEGADVNAQNKKFWTPLHFAASENGVDVAAVLLQHGAKTTAKTKYGQTPMELAETKQQKQVLKLMKKYEKCVIM